MYFIKYKKKLIQEINFSGLCLFSLKKHKRLAMIQNEVRFHAIDERVKR